MGGGAGGQNSNSLFVNQLFGKRKHFPSGRNPAGREGSLSGSLPQMKGKGLGGRKALARGQTQTWEGWLDPQHQGSGGQGEGEPLPFCAVIWESGSRVPVPGTGNPKQQYSLHWNLQEEERRKCQVKLEKKGLLVATPLMGHLFIGNFINEGLRNLRNTEPSPPQCVHFPTLTSLSSEKLLWEKDIHPTGNQFANH